jgi:small subunit ribosomal protein S16
MLKNHLLGGVAKGALTEEQAEEKFQAWLEDKATQVLGKKDKLSKEAADVRAKAFAAEKAANEARIVANAPVVEEVSEETANDSEDNASKEEE